MTDAALEAVLRRDRAIVAAALFVLAALAWAYVLWLAANMDMGDMDMSGFRMIPANTALMMPTTAPWNETEFAFVLAMWAVMMVGMMTPSATPMILIYAARRAPGGATGKAIRRDFLYQWTPLKDACLRQCRTPLQFIQHHGGFRPDAFGSLALGACHGTYCIGCCWVLMALLFVGGVMNVLWIVAVTILVLVEKLVPAGRVISQVTGAGIFASGVWVLAQTL
jgi:predicted metal-binding membrane protein